MLVFAPGYCQTVTGMCHTANNNNPHKFELGGDGHIEAPTTAPDSKFSSELMPLCRLS